MLYMCMLEFDLKDKIEKLFFIKGVLSIRVFHFLPSYVIVNIFENFYLLNVRNL